MIRTIELVEPSVSRALVLVTRRNAQLSPAARALYERSSRVPRPGGDP